MFGLFKNCLGLAKKCWGWFERVQGWSKMLGLVKTCLGWLTNDWTGYNFWEAGSKMWAVGLNMAWDS